MRLCWPPFCSCTEGLLKCPSHPNKKESSAVHPSKARDRGAFSICNSCVHQELTSPTGPCLQFCGKDGWLWVGKKIINKAAPMGISSSDAVTVGITPTALWGWPSLEGVDCVLEEQFYRDFCPISVHQNSSGYCRDCH